MIFVPFSATLLTLYYPEFQHYFSFAGRASNQRVEMSTCHPGGTASGHFYPLSPICAAEREEHCRWPTVLINRTHSHTVLLTQMTYRPVNQDTQPSAEVDPLGPTVQIWELYRLLYSNTRELVDYFVCVSWISYGSTQPLLFKFVLFSTQSIKIN